MCAQWNSKQFNPGVVISELNKIRKQKSGNVHYRGFGFHALYTTLSSTIIFDSEIDPITQLAFVRNAILQKTAGGKLDPDSVLKHISGLEDKYLRKARADLFIRTSLSIIGNAPFSRLDLGHAQIKFRFDHKKFDNSELLKRAERNLHAQYPQAYTPVLIKISCRSKNEAGERALEALDIIRGVWNLHLNSAKGLRISTGKRKPVNEIRLGPLHTLHAEDGSSVDGLWWYEPNYVNAGAVANLRSHISKLRVQTRWFRSRIVNSPLKLATVEGLVRYTRALDDWNWDSAFLGLWSTLEYLTNTLTASYDLTVKRAASLYGDYPLALEIARHLKERRNRAVHSASTNHDVETLLYQLKNYIEHLLYFYIQNPFRLESREQVGNFLDLPKEEKHLKYRLKLIKSALKYREP